MLQILDMALFRVFKQILSNSIDLENAPEQMSFCSKKSALTQPRAIPPKFAEDLQLDQSMNTVRKRKNNKARRITKGILGRTGAGILRTSRS